MSEFESDSNSKLLKLELFHNTYWEKCKKIIRNNKLSQALMFVGSTSAKIDCLISRLIALSLCAKISDEPCLNCTDCSMIIQNAHPDVQYIYPEKRGSAIKIEQIRSLHTEAYQTAQRGKSRFVIIKSAENLNKSAANALLKILEEPPTHIYFILIVEHLATLPATILSRCQIWPIHKNIKSVTKQILDIDEDDYPKGCEYRDLLLNDLLSLLKGETIASAVAVRWQIIPIKELFGLLYLILAQTLAIDALQDHETEDYLSIKTIANAISPKKIFYQLDKINALQKKISHNIHINFALAIEDFLIDLNKGENYV